MSASARLRLLLLGGVLAVMAAGALAPAATAFEVRLGRASFVKLGRNPGVSVIPDANVAYWAFPYVASRSVRTVIRGRTPRARIWAYTIYRYAPVDNLPDPRIHPRAGRYTVTVAGGCAGTPDCLDARRSSDEEIQEGLVVLRLYDPVDLGGAETGGVALPTVSYVGPGSAAGLDLSRIDLPSPLRGATEDGLQRIVETAHDLMLQPGTWAGPVVQPDNDPAPRFEQITATWPAVGSWLRSLGAPAALVDTALRVPLPNYIFPSNRYGGVTYDARRGNLELRFRAPTYRRPRWGPRPANLLGRRNGREQLRYWSLCTYEADLQYSDCLRDRDVVVGRDRGAVAIVAPSCPVAGYMAIMRNTEPSRGFAARRMSGAYAVSARYVARR